MLKKFFKSIIFLFLIIAIALIIFFVYINWPIRDKSRTPIELGVTFSYRYAKDIGLDWKENFLAILDDLKARKIRLPIYWDAVENSQGEYDFSDIDWELQEASKRQAEVVLVVGQKVPRWPECFIPEWAKNDDNLRKEKLLDFIQVAVKRYQNNPTVKYWQVENEPFLSFGICPSLDANLLDKEIALVRSIDPSHKVIVTDSGELSLWLSAAKRADIFGTTMYRKIWSQKVGYFDYPIGPNFFHLKKKIIELLAGQRSAIVIELQAEPWVDGWTINVPLETQLKYMNENILKDNISFAQKSGFSEAYLWGVEWWWWLKVNKNYPGLWDTAKELFETHNPGF